MTILIRVERLGVILVFMIDHSLNGVLVTSEYAFTKKGTLWLHGVA